MRKLLPRSLFPVLLATGSALAEPQKMVLDIPGMNCSLCPPTVKKALQRVPGFIDADMNLDTKRAVVRYESEKTSPERLAAAVTNAGYPAKVITK